MTRFPMRALAISAALLIALGTQVRAETQLKALSSMAKNLDYTQAYIQYFIDRANELGKGEVKIAFIGGPEVTPANKAAGALERGVFDFLYGPAGYYAGSVPEAFAIHGSTVGPAELRKNGGFELLDKIWNERIKAKILAWGISETAYNLFLTQEPKITAEALSLEGMKIRSSPTYRPLLLSLGATPVSIPAPEFYTAIERGVAVGSGWPAVGIARTGVGKLMKYKIEPTFYRSNHLILVNRAKWDSLSADAKKAIDQAAREYEVKSVEHLNRVQAEEEKTLAEMGLKVIELEGKARENYVKRGNAALWKLVAERSDHAKELQAKLDIQAQ